MASVSECKEMIRAVLGSAAPLTTMLWGAPGIGKTSLVGQVAAEAGVGFKSVIAHLYQPVDVLGLPYVVEGHCEYAPPTVFPDAARDGARGIFFLDELPNCVPAMQSAWGIVVLERSTKHYRFPPGWIIVCAGNRETDRAGASRLVSALENRLIHVGAEPSSDEFVTYAVQRALHPSVPAFLQERPDMLLKFDPKSPERAFPSPRAWERASDIMKLTVPEGARMEMLKGAVGAGAAVEFVAFTRVFHELPRLADVLSGAADLSTVKRPDVMRAVVYSVLAYAGEQPTVERVEQAAGVATRLPDEWAMLLIQRLYKSAPNVVLKVPSWQPLWQRLGKYIGNLSG
jgi:MoxR-like ATPase